MAVVGMGEAVFMLVDMLVRVTVYQVAVAVFMVMQVTVPVAVFMLVLQLHDLQAATVAIGEVELVEAGQVGIFEKSGGGVVLHQLAVMQNDGPLGQLPNKE